MIEHRNDHLATIIDQIDIITSAGLALGIYHTIEQSKLEIIAMATIYSEPQCAVAPDHP